MRKYQRILITAGPTREPIDPVRFLSNRSSGKMGYALCQAALSLGHHVTLISGPVAIPSPVGAKMIFVETAEEMFRKTISAARNADLIIMSAAVADYTPSNIEKSKIKKKKTSFTLKLKKTKDVLAELGRRKSRRQILVGFAAETSRLLYFAKQKLHAKNLDFIVANQVGRKDSGFESDMNKATLLGKAGKHISFPRMAKIALAKKLLVHFIKADAHEA
jgi:phosphopantothenoylcysteine decarboxylase / phosphopantothenate---cysteine ligase